VASEVEIERMVVRLVGDKAQYDQALAGAVASTDAAHGKIAQTATNLEQGAARRGAALARSFQEPIERMERQSKDLKAALDKGLITQQQYAKAMTDMKVNAGGLTRSLSGAVAMAGNLDFTSPKNALAGMAGIAGTIPGSLGVIGAAAGGAIAGIIGLSTMLSKVWEDKLLSAAGKAFDAMIDGSKTAGQALASIRVDTLADGLKELTAEMRRIQVTADGLAAPFARLEFMREGVAAGFAAGIDDVVQRAEEAQRLLREMNNNVRYQQVLREAASARAQRDLLNMQEELRLRRETVGMTERQAQLARAMRDLGPVWFREQVEAAARYEIAITEGAEALAELSAQLRDYGITTTEARARQLELMGAFEEADKLRGLERTLEALQQATERNNQAWQAAQQVFESTRRPAELYEDQMQRLNHLFNEGNLDVETYGRAVRRAGNELERSRQLAASFQLAAVGSGEDAARMQAQQEMLAQQRLPEDVRARIARRERENEGPGAGPAGGAGAIAPAIASEGAATRTVLEAMLRQLTNIASVFGGGGPALR